MWKTKVKKDEKYCKKFNEENIRTFEVFKNNLIIEMKYLKLVEKLMR